MKWKKFTLNTTTAAVDLVSSLLDELGIEGIEVEDHVPLTEAETKGMFIDILPDPGPDDGTAKVSFYLDDEKLELAKRVGASYVINSKTENVHERMQQVTEGFGADVVIEAVGSPVTYVMAVDEVGFTGRVVCIGYAKSEVAFQTKYFVQKELDIRGSRNALPADFRAVINYMKEGNCPVEELISKIAKPEGALEAMQEWTANPGKVFRILVEF